MRITAIRASWLRARIRPGLGVTLRRDFAAQITVPIVSSPTR